MNEEKRVIKDRNFIIKMMMLILSLLLIMILSITNSYGSTSVLVNEDKAINGKFEIDCLGEDNQLFIYGYEENNDKGKLIYQTKCDVKQFVKEQYIYQAIRLVIKNGEDNDDRIDYEEYFDTIQDDRLNIKMDTFTDKICFNIESKKYVDVKINDITEQQIKKFYHCFDKAILTSNTEKGESSKVVEIYINDKLKKEFVVSKPKEQLKIAFQDFSFISDELEDKINIKITNPSGKTQKLSIVDTNLGCNKKSFTIGYEYALLCNKSSSKKDKTNMFYIQLQDSSKQVYYKSYTEPPEKKEKTNVNPIYFGIGIIVIGFIAYNTYKSKSSGKDKTAITQLEDEDNEKD